MQLSYNSRRHFVRTLALGGAISILGKLQVVNDLEAQVSLSAVNTTGQIKIKLSEFPVLLSANGSVRLGINPISGNAPSGPYYPVVVNRGPGQEFYALTSQCQHASCVVESFNPDIGSMYCFCHKSQYAIDGRNIAGPAPRPLPRFDLAYDGLDTLTIQIPGLGYSVDLAPVTASSGPRIKLSFQSIENATYHLQFRQKTSDAWTRVAFSVTQDGGMDQVDLGGSGAMQSMWVDKKTSTGFYSIILELINYG
jgi:Rieske Fe-S protein